MPVNFDISLLTEDDIYLFNEGKHFRLYEKLGSHVISEEGMDGAYFAVWAPNANRVGVIGDFNEWRRDAHLLRPRGRSGIWEGFVSGVGQGARYKYWIASQYDGYQVEKADPFARYSEVSPRTASIVWETDHTWKDRNWLRDRGRYNGANSPIATYEVHLGSWIRVAEEDNRFFTYRELASNLADYVQKMGFTHVQFLPIMEHPFYGSWGYESLGYFCPTSRYGRPEDFMYLIDMLHQRGIGVILDWVPSHFPTDGHGLAYFDGTHLFEHQDFRKGFHPDWKSFIFNYGRNEVRSFLISSALFWLDQFHVDGLRVDAVASMLYLDYSRKEGQWIPNEYGGRENLEAISFLRLLNEEVYKNFPSAQTIAEESTAWPMVSRPAYVGGLGFGMKWDMGWMHDTFKYMATDPLFRRYHHNELTFRIMYAFTENFVLPLSHDEVVYGKGSLLGKMPGDEWQKLANLRLLFGYMYSQPGKKLLFMGGEFGQWREWNHDESLDWHLLEHPLHKGLQRWIQDLNRVYIDEPGLHEFDFDQRGFEWIDSNDSDSSVLSFIRKGSRPEDTLVVACNFTPVPRHNYMIGVDSGGYWKEMLNSDATLYGGSGQGNIGGVETAPISCHGRRYCLTLVLPPLAMVLFKLADQGA
ncbi:MAG: 1,4-alpha-glucan branching protein GlgB [Desulfomonilaceae bacterium]